MENPAPRQRDYLRSRRALISWPCCLFHSEISQSVRVFFRAFVLSFSILHHLLLLYAISCANHLKPIFIFLYLSRPR